jgi:molybdate transport system substrate-binding protein
MPKRFFLALFGLLYGMFLLAPVCAQTGLRVAAAADLEPVLPPILVQFQQSTGIHADATYQASAVLTTQILNGAPFDVFLSADLSYPKRLIDARMADTAGMAEASGAPIIYAKGTLVLWERKDSHLPPPSLNVLRDQNLKRLAVANPDRAPYETAPRNRGEHCPNSAVCGFGQCRCGADLTDFCNDAQAFLKRRVLCDPA